MSESFSRFDSEHSIPEFIRQITGGVRPSRQIEHERRQHCRYKIATIAELKPIDDDDRATEAAYQVVTRDVSETGVGIRDTKPITTNKVAIQLTAPSGARMKMTANVVRCDQRENSYDIGLRFVTEGSGTN